MKIPLTPHAHLTKMGILPIKNGPARFAVGSPVGLTSNAWRVWNNNADVYIACRDNFQETKVSLHASGRWRMGFTSEAIKKNPGLVAFDQNRAWEVWDKPSSPLPGVIQAFQLVFPTSELAVPPELRTGRKWTDIIYIEPAPPGKLAVVSLFITDKDLELRHESEPSFCLASYTLGDGKYAKLVAHGEPELNFKDFLRRSVAAGRTHVKSAGITIPDKGCWFFFGHHESGCRYIVVARVN